ncbi:tRNA epoxyqueuosine(34) reductase QueG [Polyangium sp. 15x6]|uniref:tRNA epoxyqueuosine(34) reductase QueG n=1 Tax=Polyangium sp. 15x6 TaxID=3042687 RepID=UPI00249B1F34|nr:tRNA epoxyqueuosine(34) reductase QueG [Polyangium sp. 15x6]MDI3283980.1 tRNA epoxyqueuosine(34) reductase QueG [Polyangium sp. 15x6]
MSASDVDQRVRERAFELGFDVVGVARADEPLDVEHDRYRAFIDAGMHGTMRYLEEHVEERRRLDTDAILPGARSVVCVGRRYARSAEAEAHDPDVARGIARYARGQDYHLFLRKKLRRLAEFIRGLGPGIDARPLCDIEPVMERAWAARAGIGFVGKNGLVIVPGQGSFVMLGEVVTTLVLTPGVPMHERCGACTRCLDACPTGAFPKPFVLDARRCISYLTIEQYEAPPEELRARIGEHLFGCDVCQEVCPYNRTAPPPETRTQQFHPLPRWSEMRLSDLASIEEEAFPETIQGTPLRRARRGGLARNAAIVAANRLARDPEGPSAVDDQRTLERAAAHDDRAAREVGVWGLLRIGKALPEPGSSGHDEGVVDPDAPPFAPRR